MGECNSNEFLCTWNINSNTVTTEKSLLIFSPFFNIGILENSNWQLRIYLRCASNKVKCLLYRRFDDYSNKRITIQIRYALKTLNEEISTTSKVSTETVQKGFTSKLCALIEFDDLEKKMSSMKLDVLTLSCHIKRVSVAVSPKLCIASYTGCEIKTEFVDYELSFTFLNKFSGKNRWSVSKNINLIFLKRIFLAYVNYGVIIVLFSNIEDQQNHCFFCTIELLNEQASPVISKSESILFNKENPHYKFPNFIFRRNLEEANCFNLAVIKLKVNISSRYTTNLCYLKADTTNSKIIEVKEFDSPIGKQFSSNKENIASCSKACQTIAKTTNETKFETSSIACQTIAAQRTSNKRKFETSSIACQIIAEQRTSNEEMFESSSKVCQPHSMSVDVINSQIESTKSEKVASTQGCSACMFSLQRDLRDLFSEKIFTDVTLRAGGEIFHAHKNLLVARSPVFLDMFELHMVANNDEVVDIPDVEARIMKSFLEYIYTGSVNGMDVEVALSLITVADKYQVLAMKEMCFSFLKSALCKNNALNVLLVADIVKHNELKSSVIDYIVENSTEVLSSSDFPQFVKLNPLLSSEVFLNMSKKVDKVLKSANDGSAPSSLRRNIEAKSDVTEMPDEKCVGKCPPTNY